AAYARAGRLPGLEAAFVADAIGRAARTSLLPNEDVLQLLLALVDRSRQPPDKAPPRTLSELSVVALSQDAVVGALGRLEADELVRQRGDASSVESVWHLDHGYLAQPILRIERERNRWRQLLDERARTYAEAPWRERWAA